MKKFLRKLLLFILPLVVLFAVLEIMLRKIPNDYKYKKEFLTQHAKELKILCLGSSHAYYDLNPQYFKSKAFNAGHIAQSLDYDLRMFKMFEPYMDSLQWIILPVSYFSLYGKLESGSEPWRIKNYLLYYNMDVPANPKYHFEMLSINLDANIKRTYNYYVLKQSALTSSSLGFGSNYLYSDRKDLNKTGAEAAKRHTKEDDVYFRENLADLNTLIKLAAKKNIKVLLFTPPAYHTYREKLNTVQLNRTMNALAEMVKQHENVVYYNYLADSSFTTDDYFDADHLNEKGAKKFTLKLSQIIEVP